MRCSRAVAVAQGLLGVGVLVLLPMAQHSLRVNKLILIEVLLLATAASLIRSRALRWAVWWSVIGFVLAYNSRAMVTCWRLLLGALAIEGIASTLSAHDLRAHVLRAWRWMTLVQTGYMLLQFAGWDPLFALAVPQTERVLVTGLMDNTTLAGAYTAMTLPLWFAGGWWVAVVPTMVAVIVTKSFGAVCVAAILLAVALKRRLGIHWWKIAASCALLMVVYSYRMEPLIGKLNLERSVRARVWTATSGMFMGRGSQIPRWQRAVLVVKGWGPGQFQPAYRGIMAQRPQMQTLQWTDASNEYVGGWFEFGTVGVLIWGAMIAGWMRAGWRSAEPAVRMVAMIALGWLLVGGYHASAHMPYLAVVGIVCAGVLEWARRQPRPVNDAGVLA